MVFETVAIIGVFILGVVAIYMIQALSQFRRTLHRMEQVAFLVQRDLGPLMQDTQAALRQIQELAQSARRGGERVGIFLDALQDIGEGLGQIRSTVAQISDLWSHNGKSLWSRMKTATSAVRRWL